MPAMMVAPVDAVVMAFGAIADDARAMHSQHPAAASSSDKGGNWIDGIICSVVVGIIVRIIVVIDAADKNPAEAMPVNAMAGKSRGSYNGRRRGDGRRRATANERTADAAEAAGTMPTAPTTSGASAATATATTAAVSAADLNRQSAGSGLRCTARTERRHRLDSLTEDRHDQQHCCARRA